MTDQVCSPSFMIVTVNGTAISQENYTVCWLMCILVPLCREWFEREARKAGKFRELDYYHRPLNRRRDGI